MPIEVVDGRKPDLTARTAFFDTAVGSRVSSVVFSVMKLAIGPVASGFRMDSLEVGVFAEGEATLIAHESLVFVVAATGSSLIGSGRRRLFS